MSHWSEEEFRGNVPCPKCGAIIPQYITYLVGYPSGVAVWDTREECGLCGYERDYNPESPHSES